MEPPLDVWLTPSALRWNETEVDSDSTRLAMWVAAHGGDAPRHSSILHVSEDVLATRMLGVMRALGAGGYLRYRVQIGTWAVDLDLRAVEGRVEGTRLRLWLQGGTWRAMKDDHDGCERTTFPAARPLTATHTILDRPISHVELVAAEGTAADLGPVLTAVAQGHQLRLGTLTPAETGFPAVCLMPTGTLPVDTLSAVIEAHHDALVRCIAPSRDVVALTFTLDPNGKLIESNIDSAYTSNFAVDVNLCVLAEFRKITFPAPTGGMLTGRWRFRFRR